MMRMHSIAKTIMDGLKDAEMQYRWAEAAHEANEPELAKMHISEAMKRLAGIKEWCGYAESKAEHNDLIRDMVEYWREWHNKLLDKATALKV